MTQDNPTKPAHVDTVHRHRPGDVVYVGDVACRVVKRTYAYMVKAGHGREFLIHQDVLSDQPQPPPAKRSSA